jgi:ribose transport system substrate-binding protein
MVFGIAMLNIIISLLALLLASAYGGNELRVGINYRCPYFCDSSDPLNNSRKGYVAELLELFGKEFNYKIKAVLVPEVRQISFLTEGKVDLLLVDSHRVTINEAIHIIEEPFGISSFGIARSAKNKLSVLELEKLVHKKFAYPKGYFDIHLGQGPKVTGKQWVEMTGKNIYHRMFRLMVLDRVELVGGDYYSLKYEIGLRGKGGYLVEPNSFIGHTPLVLAIRGTDLRQKVIKTRLGKFFKKIRSTGTLQKILKKYDVSDWVHKVAR